MALLAVVLDVVAKRLDVGMGKLLVGYLGFLQTDDIRLVPLDQLSQLMRTCAQSIDIEGNEFHGVVFHSDSSAAILTDRAGGRPDCLARRGVVSSGAKCMELSVRLHARLLRISRCLTAIVRLGRARWQYMQSLTISSQPP
ncbi:hypothetical protein D3C71_1481770 [compost metagenome]